MPDAPISTTPTIGLSQWGDKKNPGFEALNENWQLVDDAVLALQETIDALEVLVAGDVMEHGDEFPAEYAVDKLFLKTNEEDAYGTIYRNDGTFELPEFTAVLSISDALAEAQSFTTSAVSAEATERINADADLQDQIDDAVAAVAAEAIARAAEDLTLFKKDGSRALTGDVDAGSNKIAQLGNGTLSHHAINLGQLEAGLASIEGLFGVYENCLAHNSADLATGTSPRTFEADTHDEITDAGIHSTSSNKDRFIAQQAAIYMIEARMKVQGFYGGGIQWYKNGVLVPRPKHPQFLANPGGDNVTWLVDTLYISLAEGDYITVKVFGLDSPDSGTILADSSIRFFAMIANGVGGGDFFADGSVPMTGDLNFGGNRAVNMEDGVDPTDGATVGQVTDIAEDAVDDALTAADIPGQVDTAVEDAVDALDVRTKVYAEYTGADIDIPNVQTDIPDLTLTITPKLGTVVEITLYAHYQKNAESNYNCTIWFRKDATTVFNALVQQNGEPGHYREYPMCIKKCIVGTGVSQTIKVQHMGTLNRMTLHGGALAGPQLIIDYVPA